MGEGGVSQPLLWPKQKYLLCVPPQPLRAFWPASSVSMCPLGRSCHSKSLDCRQHCPCAMPLGAGGGQEPPFCK